MTLRLMLFLCLAAGLAEPGNAQKPPGIVELHAEAVAAGAAITFPPRSAWAGGIELNLGDHATVQVSGEARGVGTWATGYLVARWTPDSGWQVSLSPIGIALVVGSDFGAIYPSARLGASRFWGRVGIGTELRVVRIASGHGRGDYWGQWTPVRLSVRL